MNPGTTGTMPAAQSGRSSLRAARSVSIRLGDGAAERAVGEDDLGRVDVARAHAGRGSAAANTRAESRSPRLTMKSRVRGVSSLSTVRLESSALELVHRTRDLGGHLLGAALGRAPENLEVAGAEVVDLLRGARAVAGGRPLGEPEQHVGHAGGRRHDDDARAPCAS